MSYNRSRFNLDGERGYSVLVRIIMLAGAVAGGYVAFRFSVMGFNAQISGMQWAAYCIVIMNTSIQVYINHYNEEMGNLNLALAFAAIVSYGYGIWTNITGILAMSGLAFRGVLDSGMYEKLVIPVTIGIPLELVPEGLLVLALFPNSPTLVSDALRGLGNMVKGLAGEGEYESRPRVRQMRTTHGIRPAAPHQASQTSYTQRSVPDALRQSQTPRQRTDLEFDIDD